MIEILAESHDNYIAIKASGKLNADDYAQLIPQIETLITQHGTIHILAILDQLQGWDIKKVYDDFAFAKNNKDKLTKIAIVGEKKWKKWLTGFAWLFINIKVTQIKYYEFHQLEQARQWVQMT